MHVLTEAGHVHAPCATDAAAGLATAAAGKLAVEPLCGTVVGVGIVNECAP
ncbi:hypothetical protein OAO87_03035 [bacterium]|nr:hypothetical protein [bacterium]